MILAWMRLRGLAPASGLLAAVLFALGAKQTVHVIHWNFAATTAFWPWMLPGLQGFAAQRRSRFLLLVAAATALAWLGGSPQMAHFGCVVAGLYALRIAVDLWPTRRADAAWVVAIVPIGFVLASVLVLPTLELSRMGPRSMVVDYSFVTSWRWPDAWGLALYVLPHAYGDGRWGLNLWEARLRGNPGAGAGRGRAGAPAGRSAGGVAFLWVNNRPLRAALLFQPTNAVNRRKHEKRQAQLHGRPDAEVRRC